jgi:thiol-disulfide isomerase/thioredoxin
LVDWRRLAIAAPLIIAGGVLLYVFALRDDGAADTPRAMLAETPPGVTDDVGVRKGELARDFIALAPDGEAMRLSELRGTPAIINFWASWCTSCLAELPDFQALQMRLGVDNLNVVAVNAGEDGATARRFIDQLGIETFRVGMDPTLVVADAYGVFGLPTSVFVDADGVVRGVYAGHLTSDTLDTFVTAVRAGDDAPEPDPKLRLVTTVARDHMLEVRRMGEGVIELRSKRLRCDDSYCAKDALNALAAVDGVEEVRATTPDDPPRISVRLRDDASAEAVVDAFVGALALHPDPLYERTLEVVWL